VSGAFPQAEIGHLITEAVASATLPPSLRTLLLIPLRQPGKALHPSGEHPIWPALVLATSAATGGEPHIAVRVAAAVEVFMAAVDVFDEVEDGDQSAIIDVAGAAQAINVATALLLLAQQTILALTDSGLATERALLLARTLTAAGLEAIGGQHGDLAAEADRAISATDAHAIARQKAGALTAGVTTLGALLGTDDPEVLALYRDWGLHFGTLSQIQNDIRDAQSPELKSDLARGKSTLPLIYARGTDTGETTTLATSGALHFAWVVREIERQACEDVLTQLAERGHAVTRLHNLLARLG
jgi:geranylgeranyl diphosphate synthase type I